ncbi:MAG TPA: radical SAM protein [bacterium]|nr:radical SAM protein [bacterium]
MSRLALFAKTAAGAFRPRSVQYLILFVTSRCNARCKMCFNWRTLEGSSLDLELDEIRALSRTTPELIQLTLSGGEPFLRDDLVEIIEAFHQNTGVSQITLPTNAILTDRIAAAVEDILDRFSRLSVNLDLSIDGVGADHDEIRGRPAAYEQVLKTYRAAVEIKKRRPRLRLGMSAVLSGFNRDKIIATLDEMDREFSFDRHEVMLARGLTRDPMATEVSINDYEETHRWIKRHDRALSRSLFGRINYQMALMMRESLMRTVREDRMILPCLAGSKLAVVEADGKVRPCELLHTLYPEGRPELGLSDFELGGLRDHGYDLRKIMLSDQTRRVVQFIRDSRCHCTFECALFNSLVFNPRQWPKLGLRVLLNP